MSGAGLHSRGANTSGRTAFAEAKTQDGVRLHVRQGLNQERISTSFFEQNALVGRGASDQHLLGERQIDPTERTILCTHPHMLPPLGGTSCTQFATQVQRSDLQVANAYGCHQCLQQTSFGSAKTSDTVTKCGTYYINFGLVRNRKATHENVALRAREDWHE